MIKIQNISKIVNKKTIFNNISLNCKKNDCFILVGPNGIGKTSLIKCILGLYSLNCGSIKVLDQEISTSYNTDSNIGIYLNNASMMPHSIVKSSLTFYASLYNKSLNDINHLITTLHLENELDKTYISLSTGNKRKVGLLISIINNPDLLIWDEPFANLDPDMCLDLVNLINQLKHEGKTFLITTNDLFYAADIYTKVGFFLKSDTLVEENKDELMNEYEDKELNKIYFLEKDKLN